MNAEFIRLCSIPEVQKKIREGMGKLHWADWVWCNKCQEEEVLVVHEDQCYEEIDNLIRLPLPIDPRNPERGLWGMVTGNKSMTTDPDNNVDFYSSSIGDWSHGATPTIALLKALAVQEGKTG
jgi:hypothetical protein